MNIIKLTFAAATLTIGFMASASAMPVGNMAPAATTPVEQVRLVCNRWGNCYQTRSYGFRGGYRGGYRDGYRGGYRGGYRSSHRNRW